MKRVYIVAAPSFDEVMAKAGALKAVILSGPHQFDRLSSDAVDPDGMAYDYGGVGSDDPGFAAIAMRIF